MLNLKNRLLSEFEKYKSINFEEIKKSRIAKEVMCFAIAVSMITSAVVFDMTDTAQGQDLTELPHVIMAGDRELAVVGSAAQADSVIEDVVEYYGGGNEVEQAFVNPVLKIQVKETVAGERNPEILTAEQAKSRILYINSGKNPVFTVTVNSSLFRRDKIDFDIKKVRTKSLYEGTTKVAQKGEEGLKLITGSGTYVNGKLVDSVVYKEEVVKKPVKKIIKVGTKKRIVKGVATGEMIWPFPSSHNIVSGYGARFGPFFGYEFHMGYDIAGGYGADIVAADGGTVVKASFHPSYGNEIVIDHGNGIQTRYAHNSSLNVKVGQKVSRGQTIAFCGSTGDSTGNHLHFEVLKNGTHTDPAPFL